MAEAYAPVHWKLQDRSLIGVNRFKVELCLGFDWNCQTRLSITHRMLKKLSSVS